MRQAIGNTELWEYRTCRDGILNAANATDAVGGFILQGMVAGILKLGAVLLVLGAALMALTVALVARLILRPPRMTDGKAMFRLHRLSPGDMGMDFENHDFTVRDQRWGGTMRLAGWWIPCPRPSVRCAIVMHGYGDAKVGALDWAAALRRLGLNILAIDLRAHGESDGKNCTGGFFEREDLNQVIDQLRADRPRQTRQLVLFGVSLGGAVAAAVASRRADVAAVILESPLADYRRAIAAQAKMIGFTDGALLQSGIALAQFVSGAKFDAVRPADTIGQIRCPLLLILGREDELLSDEDFAALRAALAHRRADAGTGTMVVIDGAGHLMAMWTDPNQYMQQLGGFLESALLEIDGTLAS